MWTVSFFNSVQEAWVAHTENYDLDGLVALLTQPFITDDKKKQLLFTLSRFKTIEEGAELARNFVYEDGERTGEFYTIAGRVRRCKENLVSLGGLVLDVDDTMSIDQAIEKFDGLYMIIYTTHSHTWDKHKFRIILPFSQPLLAADIEARKQSIIETFPGVDHASFSASQSFYFHSSPDASLALADFIPGMLIDPYVCFKVAQAPATPVYDKTKSMLNKGADPVYFKKVVDALRTCSGVRYNSARGDGSGVLILVSICKSIGMNFENFSSICEEICAPDSTLKDLATRKVAWTGWSPDKITGPVRDKYIELNGGRAVKTPGKVVSDNAELNAIIKKLNKR